MNKDDYMEGICKVCFNIEEGVGTKIRNKNLYLTGSEGLDICWTCEKKVLEFIRSRKLYYQIILKKQIKFKRIKRNCEFKIMIGINIECIKRRLIISGLDGCLCREDNCFKFNFGRGEINGIQ